MEMDDTNKVMTKSWWNQNEKVMIEFNVDTNINNNNMNIHNSNVGIQIDDTILTIITAI